MSRKLKILQINAVYGIGSTGTLVRDIHREIENTGNTSWVYWGIKSVRGEENVFQIGNIVDHKIHAILRRIDMKQGWHSTLATKKLIKDINFFSPDIVHLHNLHSNYINVPVLLKFLGKKNVPVLITLHDCWFFTGVCTHYYEYNCLRWQKGCEACPLKVGYYATQLFRIKQDLWNNINCLAVSGVSKWITEAAKESMFGQDRIYTTIYNWIDEKVFFPEPSREYIAAKYKIKRNVKWILGVSQAWGESKGIKEFCKIKEIFGDDIEVLLTGNVSGIPRKSGIKALGYIKDKSELRKLYSSVNLFVNLSKAESFGLTTIESMACGTPVVAFNNTGCKELISDGCGMLAEDCDIDSLVEMIKKILLNGEIYSHNCIEYVHKEFNKGEQVKKYLNLYKDMISYDKGKNRI